MRESKSLVLPITLPGNLVPLEDELSHKRVRNPRGDAPARDAVVTALFFACTRVKRKRYLHAIPHERVALTIPIFFNGLQVYYVD